MRSSLCQALRACAGFLALAALVAVVGCGGSNATVKGKVIYKDPVTKQDVVLKGGNVTFACDNGPTRAGTIAEDGTYTIQNVPAGGGKFTVQTKHLVSAALPKGAGPPKDASGSVPEYMKSSEDAARRFVAIPSKYEDAETSPLTYTVKQGPQEYDLVLEGPLDSGGSGGQKGSGGGPPKGSSGGPPKK